METFSLLKYWRGGGAAAVTSRAATVTTIAHSATDTDGDDEDGPFFDLEFAANDGENASDFGGAAAESDGEFDFTLSSASGTSSDDDGNSDVNLPLSPADDLFFKGRLLPVIESDGGDSESKPQFPVSLMKSATKLRVFMLGLKKQRGEKPPPEEKEAAAERDEKLFAVKLKVDEVPIKSLFSRENSTRREAVQRYLKKVKPLYVRVSRRHGEKTPSGAGKLSPPEIVAAKGGDFMAAATSPKHMNLPVGLREVCKHLGKSRSASSAAVAAAVPGGSRRDDSLLEQQDGIQGAILHCKRSFNASRDSESSVFFRSVSDMLKDKSSNLPPATSSDEDRN